MYYSRLAKLDDSANSDLLFIFWLYSERFVFTIVNRIWKLVVHRTTIVPGGYGATLQKPFIFIVFQWRHVVTDLHLQSSPFLLLWKKN